MDDVIERVREYAKNLANNGAPHQTGIGRDILKVADLVDVTNAKAAVTDAAAITAAITAASAAKALQDELNETNSSVDELMAKLTEALEENKRLSQAVADAAAENTTLRAEIERIGTLPVNEPADLELDKTVSQVAGLAGDGIALTSASHEQFGTSIDEVAGKMRDGGIMGPNGEVTKPAKRRKA